MAMSAEELEIYRKIICEQIELQELQQRRIDSNIDPLGVSRRVKDQRSLLSQLWSTAHDLSKLTPLS